MSPAPEGKYDLCVLATQPPQVEDAARTALPHLAPDANVVVLQNGLCEERIAAIVGPERVIGAIVAWGASMPEPGKYERTAAGGFQVGRLAPIESDTDLDRVAELLEAIGPVTVTKNLRGARWSKLALNCAVSSLGTIAGETLGPLVRVRRYRRLALELMTEAVAVAKAENVELEKVSGTLDLAWIALTDADRKAQISAALTAKHALLLAVGLALSPDALVDARRDRTRENAGDRLLERRGRVARRPPRDRDAVQSSASSRPCGRSRRARSSRRARHSIRSAPATEQRETAACDRDRARDQQERVLHHELLCTRPRANVPHAARAAAGWTSEIGS